MTPPSAGWLIALPLVAAPLVALAGRLVSAGAARGTALAALLATGALLALAAGGPPPSARLGMVQFRADALSVLVVGLTLALAVLVVVYDGPELAEAEGVEKHYALLLVVVGAAAGLACAGDLFNLWVWFEALALASYLLVALEREREATLAATATYLVQGTLGSVLVVLGIALVLNQTGTLGLEEIRASAAGSPVLLAAGALLVVGFGVKAALVPLHTWLPDAYAWAPSGASALLAGAITKLGLLALLRALAALAGVSPTWGLLLMGAGVLNACVGNLLALRQTQVKRLLAYSSLAHLGYILLGVGIAVRAGGVGGAQGGLFHFLTHGIMTALAFLVAGALATALHPWPADRRPLLVTDLAGAAQRYPLAALALSLALLGLGGLPPLAGFMSEWQIFAAGFATRDPLPAALVVVAALNVVLSLGYYAPLVNVVYRQQPSAAMARGRALPLATRLPLAALALAVVALGIWPAAVSGVTAPAGAALLAAFGG